MSIDTLTLLGPGPAASELSSLGDDFSTTLSSFNNILQFPHLANMVIPGNTDDTQESLRDFVTLAQGDFNVFTQQVISVSRGLVSFGGIIRNILAKKNTPSLFAATLGPIIERNYLEVQTRAAEKKIILEKLSAFLEKIKIVIKETEDRTSSLIAEIASAESAIENDNILETIVTLLQNTFQFAKDIKSKGLQVASLIGLTTEALNGSFKEKLQQREQRKNVISSLTQLKSRLGRLVVLFEKLQASLPQTIEAIVKLTEIWAFAHGHLGEAKIRTDELLDVEVQSITAAWNKTSEIAAEFLHVLIGADARSMQQNNVDAQSDVSVTTFPTTPAEFEAAAIVDEFGTPRRPLPRASPHVIKGTTPGSEAPREKPQSSMVSAPQVDEEKKEALLNSLNPPDVQQTLVALNGSLSGMIETFTKMLQTPFLSSIQVPNPLKDPQTKASPQSSSLVNHLGVNREDILPDKIPLDELIKVYQSRFQALQQDTIPVARGLATYASLQVQLIPKLTLELSTTGSKELTIDQYLSVNRNLVAQFQSRVEELVQRMIDFQNSWQNVINLLQATLNEQAEKLSQAQEEIERLGEEKNGKTLWGVLGIIGAVVCFTAAALVPAVGVLGIGSGIGFLTKSVAELQAAGQLGQAIAHIQTQLGAATKTKDALEIIKPVAIQFKETMIQMTKIWNQIAQRLSDLGAQMLDSVVFGIIVDEVVKNWKEIQVLIAEYTGIVTGVTKK